MRRKGSVCARLCSIDGGRQAGLYFKYLDEQRNILVVNFKGNVGDGMVFFHQLALGLLDSVGNDVFLCACVNLLVAKQVDFTWI